MICQIGFPSQVNIAFVYVPGIFTFRPVDNQRHTPEYLEL